jgi:hypothetical protein
MLSECSLAKKDNVESRGTTMTDKRIQGNADTIEANQLSRELALQVEENERSLAEEMWRRYWESVEGGYRNSPVLSPRSLRRRLKARHGR